MLVQNTTKSLRSIPLTGKRLHLLPGLNKVEDKDWQEAEKLVMIKVAIDEGDLELLGDKPLGKMSITKAIELIKECFVLDQLKAFLADEKRVAVQRALTAQIASLTEEPKKD